MRDKQNRLAQLLQFLNAPQATMLENRIADCQRFIDQQDLGLDGGGDREGHPHVHAAGICFHRLIEKGTDFGEAFDPGKERVDLAP